MNMIAPADLMFLLLESHHSPMHVAGLSIYSPPADAGPTFVAELVSAWKRYPKPLPPFNQRAVQHMGIWCWEEDQDFELDCHIQHLALPHPGRMSDLLDLVAHLHSQLLDRQRSLWQAYIIEGLPGGRFATYVKIHHALVDGVTGAKMMEQNLAHSPGEQKAPLWAYAFEKHPRPPAEQPAGFVAGLIQQASSALQTSRQVLPGILAGWWDILRPAHPETGEALPLQAPPSSLNQPISGVRSFAAQTYSLQRLQAIGHACGGTVNDVALAMCAGALRQYLLSQHQLPRKSLIAMVPVSLHEAGSADGNQVSLLLARLATTVADPGRRLKAIIQSTQTAKQRLSRMSRLEKWSYIAPMVTLIGPLMFSGEARQHPLFNVIVSNVPGPRQTLYLNGARLEEVYPVSIPTHYLNLNITLTSYGDTLGFGFIACRHAVPDAHRLAELTTQALLELEQSVLEKPARKPPVKRKTSAARLK